MVSLVALVIAAASPVADGFWSRDLGAARGAFERGLVESGLPDAEAPAGPTHVWAELFDLVDCVPLGLDQRGAFKPRNEWERLIALARLERMRLARLGGAAPIARDLRNEAFFLRIPAELPPDVIAWPASDEVWTDEVLRPEARESSCATLPAAGRREASVKEELALAESVLAGMSDADPAWFALTWHRVALLLARGDFDAALASATTITPELVARLPAEEAAVARLLRVLRKDVPDDEAANELTALRDSPFLQQERAFIEARLQATLAKQGRWAELLDVLPATSDVHDPVGRYQAWLRGRASVGAGRVELLLGHARESLRAASDAELRDPALQALADLEYGFLATAPFDEHVVEIVESLGPPRLLYTRLARLARVALDRGQYASARDVWSWLLAHHQVAEYHPRYRAGLAEVAFVTGDLPVFRAFVRELTASDARLAEAIPPARRGAFFQERDRQLLSLARAMLPRLADRSDDRWTAAFVELLQQFLRESPESRVIPEITELYRTTRTLLDSGAKAYAERIGSKTPPLVLGEVEVERITSDPPPPRAPATLHEPPYLVRIPVGAEPRPARAWFSGVSP